MHRDTLKAQVAPIHPFAPPPSHTHTTQPGHCRWWSDTWRQSLKISINCLSLITYFFRVKRGSPLEVECVCAVLPSLLADFFPASEVLTKVIGEFLSPQQPNHMHLSAVVFQVSLHTNINHFRLQMKFISSKKSSIMKTRCLEEVCWVTWYSQVP